MSTLKSIGSSENGPEECVCETTEARHELACPVLLGLACIQVFSPQRLPLAVPRTLVGATKVGRRQTLG